MKGVNQYHGGMMPEKVELSLLRSHERIRKNHYRKLRSEIRANRYVKPIIVDGRSMVILDGHHRFNVMKSLGFREIPAFLVDYSDPSIKVYPRRKRIPVSKEVVVERGLNGEPFPPKTTRHVISGLREYQIPIEFLERLPSSNGIASLIGNTPLVKIGKLNPNPNVRIYAKLEGHNPGGSVKDRIALEMVRKAEEDGTLTKGKTIIEPTSGNTGIGLAMVAASRGYRMKAVMSSGVSGERRKLLRALGAEIVLTPAEKGTDGAIMKAREIVRKSPEKYFMPDQFSNPANVLAHYSGTGPEILRQTGGRIDVLVAGMGTTGTLMGAGRRLKEYNPAIRIVGAEPVKGHKVQGLKNMQEAIVPGIYDPSVLDEKITVKDRDAFRTARLLASKEGILAGMSSGAAMWVALRKARRMRKGVIVVILPDRADRYLSTGLFS